jgi:hypothetical protein
MAIVVFGSSRPKGNTRALVDRVFSETLIEVIDLTQCQIHDFDYQNRHENDDSIPVMKKVIQHQDRA